MFKYLFPFGNAKSIYFFYLNSIRICFLNKSLLSADIFL